jgi:hypothetical protein
MVSPDTVPVYVMAVDPTVPNVIALPLTVPVRCTVPPGDRWIVPLSFPDDSVQVRTNVPEKLPLYVPDQVPVRAPCAAGDEAVGVGTGVETEGAADAAGVDAAGGDELGVPVPDELLHPDANATGSSTTAAARRGRRTRVRMTEIIRLPFPSARRHPPPLLRWIDGRAVEIGAIGREFRAGGIGRILEASRGRSPGARPSS